MREVNPDREARDEELRRAYLERQAAALFFNQLTDAQIKELNRSFHSLSKETRTQIIEKLMNVAGVFDGIVSANVAMANDMGNAEFGVDEVDAENLISRVGQVIVADTCLRAANLGEALYNILLTREIERIYAPVGMSPKDVKTALTQALVARK